PISLDQLADTLEGAIIKRRAHGREQGVAILSEGLAERLDPKTLGAVERDAYGNVRLAELDLGRLLKERVHASLKARGVDSKSVAPLARVGNVEPAEFVRRFGPLVGRA